MVALGESWTSNWLLGLNTIDGHTKVHRGYILLDHPSFTNSHPHPKIYKYIKLTLYEIFRNPKFYNLQLSLPLRYFNGPHYKDYMLRNNILFNVTNTVSTY